MKGEIYHILNRGVEKRKIFLKDKDYIRFAHNLGDFNNTENVNLSYRRRRGNHLSEVAPPTDEQLVDILCWALMPNHPHVMVLDKQDKGVSKFSQKIFGGYTMYFNEQNKRSGVLFQGRSKIILIKSEHHFLSLPFYIHLNPLDLFQPKWKEEGIRDIKKAIKFLEEYPWSNYRDIIGKGTRGLESVTNINLFFKIFNTNEKKYKKDFENWIISKGYKQDFTTFE